MSSIETFSERLSIALKSTHISKSNLALMLDVSPATISGWLRNKSPTIENLIKISQTLNISLCWLVNGFGPMNLHGPMHISPDEEELLLQLRFFPDSVVDHIFAFLASITNAESDVTLINRARATNVLSSVGIAMAVFDDDGILQDINDEYLSILNLEPSQKSMLIGHPVLDWVAPQCKGEMILQSKQAIRNGFSECFRCDHIRYNDSRQAPVIISGAHHGEEGAGFCLVTAFPLPF